MKFSPTLTLTLVLATGMAGGAMAQSAATPGAAPNNPQPAAQNVQAGWQPGQAHPSFTQPPAEIGQTQPGRDQMQAGAQSQSAPAPAQPNQMRPDQMQQGFNAPPAGANAATRPTGGQAAAAADDRVRQAQQQLQAAGLYNGPVDGVMDPDTRAALARFQQQHGLRRSQGIDQATMSRLMNSQAAGSGTSAAVTPTPDAGPPTAAPATGAGGNAAGQPMGR